MTASIRTPRLDLMSLDEEAMERAVNGDPSGIERVIGAALPDGWVDDESWLLNYRWHRCDYEVLTATSEAMVQLSMIHLLLKRLA